MPLRAERQLLLKTLNILGKMVSTELKIRLKKNPEVTAHTEHVSSGMRQLMTVDVHPVSSMAR